MLRGWCCVVYSRFYQSTGPSRFFFFLYYYSLPNALAYYSRRHDAPIIHSCCKLPHKTFFIFVFFRIFFFFSLTFALKRSSQCRPASSSFALACVMYISLFFIFIFLSPESDWEKEREPWWRDGFDLCELLLHPDAYVLFPLLLLLRSLIRFMYKCTLRAHTHTSHQGIRFLMARYHRANKRRRRRRRRRRQLFPLCQIKGDDDTNITPTKSINSVCIPGKTVTKCSCLSLSRQLFIVTLQLISQTRSCSSAKLLCASAIFSIPLWWPVSSLNGIGHETFILRTKRIQDQRIIMCVHSTHGQEQQPRAWILHQSAVDNVTHSRQ